MSKLEDAWQWMTKPSQERYDEAVAQVNARHAARVAREQERQVTRGRARACGVCGAITTTLRAPVCPTCLSGWDGAPPVELQAFRTYTATPYSDLDQTFRAEAALMAKADWRVTSQAYGGASGAVGATLAFGVLGAAAAKRKPTHLTVVYERNQADH